MRIEPTGTIIVENDSKRIVAWADNEADAWIMLRRQHMMRTDVAWLDVAGFRSVDASKLLLQELATRGHAPGWEMRDGVAISGFDIATIAMWERNQPYDWSED